VRRPELSYDLVQPATLGCECSVSVALFSTLADEYGVDLAIIWIDSQVRDFRSDVDVQADS